MSEVVTNAEAERLQRLCVAGVRPTVARSGVLQVLEEEAPKRLDMDAVFQGLLERGIHLTRGTVYRALGSLVAHGLLLREWRSGISGAKAVYGLMTPDARVCDVEITCKKCGCAADIGNVSLHKQLRCLALDRGLDLTVQPMTILAMCTQCAKYR